MTAATGYDGLSSRLIPEVELRSFLLTCLEVGEDELFLAHQDAVPETLAGMPADRVFAVFCTWWTVAGDFAMGYSVGIDAAAAARVTREQFVRRLSAAFDAEVLSGDQEPPGLWTLTRPDGTSLLVQLDEEDGHFRLMP
ncbi:hypothetical protein FB561_2805 [Kribbella amoyensis]|uniref:Uncharacterized protein n=1 Tax=Kribbella amoyensis TaxID=996641 RepID=A0A561BS18_9ACTN|nr:hypothetical protein [Kribbella amoyensis]TWD81684.1 hypothetical protein FB561_2805 [Kribbella amoyensis]